MAKKDNTGDEADRRRHPGGPLPLVRQMQADGQMAFPAKAAVFHCSRRQDGWKSS